MTIPRMKEMPEILNYFKAPPKVCTVHNLPRKIYHTKNFSLVSDSLAHLMMEVENLVHFIFNAPFMAFFLRDRRVNTGDASSTTD